MREIKLSNFKNEIYNSKLPFIVLFKTSSCHLCNNLKPIFEQVENKFFNLALFGITDIGREEELGNIFCEEGVPTIHFFHKGKSIECPYPKTPDALTGFPKEYLEFSIGKFVLEIKNER